MSSLSPWRDDPRFFHSLCTSWRPPPQQNLVSQTTFAPASLGAVATDMCSRRALRRQGRCRALPPARSPGSVTDRRPGSGRQRRQPAFRWACRLCREPLALERASQDRCCGFVFFYYYFCLFQALPSTACHIIFAHGAAKTHRLNLPDHPSHLSPRLDLITFTFPSISLQIGSFRDCRVEKIRHDIFFESH